MHTQKKIWWPHKQSNHKLEYYTMEQSIHVEDEENVSL